MVFAFFLGLCVEGKERQFQPPSLPLNTRSVSIRKTDEAVLAVPVLLYSTCFQRQEGVMEALNTIAVEFSLGHF